MSKLDRWVDYKFAQNLFVWVFIYVILLTTIQTGSRLLTALFAIALLAPPVYLNNLYVLPILRRSLAKGAVLFILNLLVFTSISVALLNWAIDVSYRAERFLNFAGILLLALLFATALKLARDSFARRQEEKLAELKLLKEQLNPHFLFNTLNNLYGLSVAKSEKLPSLMLKLSDLLRYSLYETKEDLVPLEKEVAYLENYVALEKIRLEEHTKIEFRKEGNLEGFAIAPMLLIVFVENAFKHSGTTNYKNNFVNITLKIQENHLFFKCFNSQDLKDIKEMDFKTQMNGLGLKNVKKRLHLIYPQKHQLQITEEQNSYLVDLTVEL
ncbi:MAG: sensor histidine kinase [Croceivirga sp.]